MIINLEHIPEASKIFREKSHIRILSHLYLLLDL